MVKDPKKTDKVDPVSLEKLFDNVQYDIAKNRIKFFEGIQKIPKRILIIGLVMEIVLLLAQVWAICRNGSIIWWQVTAPVILITVIGIMGQLVKADIRKYSSLYEKSNLEIFKQAQLSLKKASWLFNGFVFIGHSLVTGMTLYSVNYDRLRYQPLSYAYNTLMFNVDDEYYKQSPDFKKITQWREEAIEIIESAVALDPTMLFTPSQVEFLPMVLIFFLVLSFIIQAMSIFLDTGLGAYFAGEIAKGDAARVTFKVEQILNKVETKSANPKASGDDDKNPSSTSQTKKKTPEEIWAEDLAEYNDLYAKHKKNTNELNKGLHYMAGAFSDFALALSMKNYSKSIIISKSVAKNLNKEDFNKHRGVFLVRYFKKFEPHYNAVRKSQGLDKPDFNKLVPTKQIKIEENSPADFKKAKQYLDLFIAELDKKG